MLSVIAGLFGNSDMATFMLAIGVVMLMAYLFLYTIVNYLIIDIDDDNSWDCQVTRLDYKAVS